MTCYETVSGKAYWQEQIPDRFNASPVAVGDLAYFPSESGKGVVLRARSGFEIVAPNDLGEPLKASPAVSDGRLFIRSENYLWCFELTFFLQHHLKLFH